MMEKIFRQDLKNFKTYQVGEEDCRVRLDANESFINFPEQLKKEFLKEIEGTLFNRYPNATASEVCKLYGKYAKIEEKYIMAGNGSDECIQMIMNAFLERGDKVAVQSPDFSMYGIYAQIAGGMVVEFPLDKEFKLEAEKFVEMAKAEKVKVLILSNPNNPTGGVIPTKDLLYIIQNCTCIVVIDEAYYEFYGETVINEVKSFENLIILRTCSKAAGLAAIRLGFLITGETLMKEIQKVKPPFNVNTMTQSTGSVLLKNSKFIQKSVETICEEREYLKSKLEKREKAKVYPSKGNFLLVEFENVEEIKKKLSEKGITVRSFAHPALEKCLRITVGNRTENEIFLSAIG